MNLPYTSNSLLFWLDCSEKYVQRNSHNTVIGVVERQSGELLVPTTFAGDHYPTWVNNVINQHPVFRFDGYSTFKFPLLPGSPATGTNKPIALMVVANCTDQGAAVSIGSANTGASFETFFTDETDLTSYRFDDLGDEDTGNNASITVGWHVITTIYDGINLIQRVDGVQKYSVAASNTNGQPFTSDWVIVGSDVFDPVDDHYIGDIACVIVYEGKNGSIDLNPETWLLEKFGL